MNQSGIIIFTTADKQVELSEEVVVRKLRTTTKHGAITEKTQNVFVNGYNLDVIISVGYRVKSQKGTQFRIWATQCLKDYLVKGYAINQQRLAENKQQFLQTLYDLKILSNDKINPQKWSSALDGLSPSLVLG